MFLQSLTCLSLSKAASSLRKCLAVSSLNPLHVFFFFTSYSLQYGIVLDAGSSHTALYIYKWQADKQNGTGVVTQHTECHVKGKYQHFLLPKTCKNVLRWGSERLITLLLRGQHPESAQIHQHVQHVPVRFMVKGMKWKCG